MDYKELDIFQKEKFQLYSKTRDRHFRFIRYNGRNYDEIVSFIHGLSPNTEIWPEERLKVGTLYNYSGRDYKMGYVDRTNLRGVIVNNPFIICENGQEIPLALNRDEAVSYLSLSSKHAVFCPQKALATFKMDLNDGKLYEYSKDHPKGIDREKLPLDEFYICSEPVKDFSYNAEFDIDRHELIITYQFKNLVENFEKTKYYINRLCIQSRHKLIFEPTWDNWKTRYVLSQPCLNSWDLMDVLKRLHSMVFDDMGDRKQLDAIKIGNHPFVKDLKDFFDYFVLGKMKSETVEKKLLLYYNSTDRPACANDFENLQKGLYEDFRIFLNEIFARLNESKSKTVIIQQDDNGNVHNRDIQFADYLSEYKGCMCTFSHFKRNNNIESGYDYYCDKVDYVEIKEEGVIQVDSDSNLFLGKYLIPKKWGFKEGESIKITQIRPNKKQSPYKGIAVEYDRQDIKENNYEKSEFLKYILLPDPAKKIEFLIYLHEQLVGMEGQQAVYICRAAILANLIYDRTPNTAFTKEFGKIFKQQQYSEYGKSQYKGEIKTVLRHYFERWQ